jgi:hypothetical protein
MRQHNLHQEGKTHTLRKIYFACFNSVMKCKINLRHDSAYSKEVFTAQKEIVGIIVGVKPRNFL